MLRTLGSFAIFLWLASPAIAAQGTVTFEVSTPELDAAIQDLRDRMEAEEAEQPVDLGPVIDRLDKAAQEREAIRDRLDALESGGTTKPEPEPASWRTDNGDGTYTLHTVGYGNVTINAGYVARVGDCADCVPLEEARSNAPSEGGVLHVYGGKWGAVPSLGKHTTIIGHDTPVFSPGNQWGGGPVPGGWLIVSGIKTENTTLWSHGDPRPRGLFIIDSEMDGHNEGAIFTSQGCGLLEVHNTEIYDGGRANVRHNVYSHCDVTVGKNVYSHSPNGSHAWKVVSDKQVLIGGYVSNVSKELIDKFRPLDRRIAEYFRWGSEKYEGLRPDQEGGPTGDWAVKPDWTLEDWRQLADDFRHVWQTGGVGTTPVDIIACADSWIENTHIAFLRVPAAWMAGGYAESGENALQFRHRRTEIGGCDKPGWWEDEFYQPETWDIGDVTDPKNHNLMQHFIGPDVQIEPIGPRQDQVNLIRNLGTAPIDRGGSGGTRENLEHKDMPPYWIEKSRVWAANSYPDWRILEFVHPKSRCTEPCTTTEEQRRTAIYDGSDPAQWPSLSDLLAN